MVNFEPTIQEIALAFPSMRVISRLGSGGQRTVFKVVMPDGKLGALKIALRRNPASAARADREQVAAQKVIGEHFADVYDAGEISILNRKCDYFLEEFIDGESLKDRLAHGALPLNEAHNVGASLLVALAELEPAKIVHRDIKPDNIMLQSDGRVVLIDLGIARHTEESSITADMAISGPLSPGYCAPEQVRNKKHAISTRTDLFALGVVIYEMVTGVNPFMNNVTVQQALQRCLTFSPPSLQSLGFSRSLSSFVSMCMEKSPSRRPTLARARALFDDIDWSRS